MIAYFKRQRAIKDLLAGIVPCFLPVQDEIGNVPPATHSDPKILANLYAIIYATLDSRLLADEYHKKSVTDIVFEELFRREATTILNRCDQWMTDPNCEFYPCFETNLKRPQDQVLSELATYINANYEQQEYRDL